MRPCSRAPCAWAQSSITARPCECAAATIWSIAAILPYRCTATSARVRGVARRSMSAGSKPCVCGSTSQNTGRAPPATTAATGGMPAFVTTSTSSPGSTPTACSAMRSASVPEATPMQCASGPWYAAKARSNASPSGPRMNQPPSSTRAMAASISARASRTEARRSLSGMFRMGLLEVSGNGRQQDLRLLLHHGREPQPQARQLPEGVADAPEVEELAAAVGPGEVVHRHLTDGEPAVLDARHQFDRDAAAVALQLERLQHAAPDQPEVAVHVAHAKVEQEGHEVVIGEAHEAPVPPILPLHLPALDGVHVRSEVLVQHTQLAGVVLRIAVGVEDEVLGRGAEAAAKCGAVAAVRAMGDDAKVGAALRQVLQHLGGAILAAVVYDDDLEVVGQQP